MRDQNGSKNPNWKGGFTRTKEYYKKNKAAYRERHRDKHLAHKAVQTAVARGKLVRLPCEVCGDVNSHAHHDDYSKYLDVKWLCKKHHEELHMKKPISSVAPGPGTANQSTEGVMEISLSQEQIESLIEKSMPDIKKAVVENVASRMAWSISDTLAQQVKEFVTEWVKENVLPDVATHLVTNKDMLVGVAAESAPKIAMLVSEAMADSIKKTLEDRFSRGKLFDALLKS